MGKKSVEIRLTLHDAYTYQIHLVRISCCFNLCPLRTCHLMKVFCIMNLDATVIILIFLSFKLWRWWFSSFMNSILSWIYHLKWLGLHDFKVIFGYAISLTNHLISKGKHLVFHKLVVICVFLDRGTEDSQIRYFLNNIHVHLISLDCCAPMTWNESSVTSYILSNWTYMSYNLHSHLFVFV